MISGIEALLPVAPRVQLFIDFDGTIAPDEPTDAMFEAFAGPGWKALEREVEEGTRTASDCAARQIAMIDASKEELEGFLATRRIDPDFAAFVRHARSNRLGLLVVSDGFDLVIRTMLANAGLELPLVANAMALNEDGRWQASFPYQRRDCAMGLGNCKCSHMAGAAKSRPLKVMVGDGRSDFCIAEKCDLVLAKGRLAQRCQERGVPHIAITGFADALEALSAWLQSQAAIAAAA